MNLEEYRRMFDVEATHWWYSGMREIMRAVAGDPAAGEQVLDAGCGTGFELTRCPVDAVGVDVAHEALRLCRMRGLSRTVRASIEALPFAAGSFDRVVTLDVLYHRGVTDDARATRELARMLRPGGLLVLRVPALAWLSRAHDRAVHTRERYTRGRLVELIERAGLDLVRATYCNTLLLPVVAARTLTDRWASGGSELARLPPAVEAAVRACLVAEARILRHRDLPLGASLLAVARKPA
jgi:SAM-dependent methyltransferase